MKFDSKLFFLVLALFFICVVLFLLQKYFVNVNIEGFKKTKEQREAEKKEWDELSKQVDDLEKQISELREKRWNELKFSEYHNTCLKRYGGGSLRTKHNRENCKKKYNDYEKKIKKLEDQLNPLLPRYKYLFDIFAYD